MLNVSGNANLSVSGTIYAPAAQLRVSGNGILRDTLVVNSLHVSGNAGAFQLAGGASSTYVSSTGNQLVHPILTVAVRDDTGAGDKLSHTSSFGLVWVGSRRLRWRPPHRMHWVACGSVAVDGITTCTRDAQDS